MIRTNKQLHEMAMERVAVLDGTALDVTGKPLGPPPASWDDETKQVHAELLVAFTKAADQFWLASGEDDILRIIDDMPDTPSFTSFKDVAGQIRHRRLWDDPI